MEVKAETEVITAATPSGRAALVAASAVAGGLAVPLDVVATPLSAAGLGLFAALGLFVWRWYACRVPGRTPMADCRDSCEPQFGWRSDLRLDSSCSP